LFTRKTDNGPVQSNQNRVSERTRLHQKKTGSETANPDLSLNPANILQLQSAIGNRAVTQFLKSSLQQPVQCKVDPIQMMDDLEEEEFIQEKKDPRTAVYTSGTQMDDPTKLPQEIQTKMESAFNTDFSDVRVHSNSGKARMVGALAYTQGSSVHFAPGQYNPKSQSGQRILGHELAHVMQQREGRVQPNTRRKGVAVNDQTALEKEADDMGAKAATAISQPGMGLQTPVQTNAEVGSGTVQMADDEQIGHKKKKKSTGNKSQRHQSGIEHVKTQQTGQALRKAKKKDSKASKYTVKRDKKRKEGGR
jgi:hypothetical protein